MFLAGLAFVRGRLSDSRKADTSDFTAVTGGFRELFAEQRVEIVNLKTEVSFLRNEVHECEMDKARMRGSFETEIRNLKERLEATGA